MTKLTKPVTRETPRLVGNRPIILTLTPAGAQNEALINLRLKGRRTGYTVALSDLYRIAAQWHGLKLAAARKAARKAGIPWARARKDFEKSTNP